MISVDSIIILINYMIFFKCAIGHNSKFEVDLTGYVTTKDLKQATGIYTSELTKADQ